MDPFTIFVTVVSIISGVASYQQAKKIQREVDRESRGVEANIESNIKAIPVVYGERRVGGVRVYIDTSKDIGNKYLYMVMAMAEGEVEDIHSIEIDDVPITDEKFILSGLGANFTYEVFYGSDTQSASDLIIDGVAYSSAAEVPPEVAIYLAGQESDKPWNQNHQLNGVAYLAMRFLWDSNAYNGVPNVTAIVKGKKVYDPRNPTAPKAWSTNPALCIRDYLTSTRYGKGMPESAINDTMIAQAANDYDSFVVTPYDGGDDITLFEMNTVLDTEVEIIKNLNDMLMSCRGFLPYVDGKYGMRVDQATNHVMEVNSDHIIGGISIAGTKKEDRFNQVKVNFFNKDKEYKEDTAVFPDVDDPSDVNNLYQTYLAEDGGEPLVDDIKIDGISNYYTAREMAKLFLLRSRLGTAIGFTGTSELMELEVGDTFLITQPTPAWTNKKFQVQEIGLNFDGTVNIQAIEYSDAIYTYNTASEETPFVPTKLPNPNKLAPVTDASASAGSFIDTDGRTVPFIDISWKAPNDALVDRYEIKYTINDEAVIYSAVAIDTTHRIVEAKGSYDIEIYAVNGFGAKSTGVTLSDVVAVADTSAPSNITGVSISSALQSISLKWTNPIENDFDLVRIKVADTDVQPTEHLFEVRSDSFVHDIGAYSTTKHYWLAPVDRTGNVGNYVSGGTATTGSIAIGDVPAVAGTFYLTLGNNDAPTNAEFLAKVGRNPIEGDVVVVNKAYFFTRGASAWTAVTEFIDGSLLVSGSVKASQIDVTGLITSGSLAVTGDLPTAVSDLTNDTGFITSVSWAEVTSKPTDLATDTDVDNAINDIKVSGRNLVSAISLDGSPTDGVYGGKKYARKLARNLSNYRIDNWDGLSKVRPSGKYSLSFWVKVHDASDSPITGDRTLTVDIGDANYTNYTVNSDWQYCTIENVNVSTYLGSPYYGFIDLYVADNIYIYVSNVKLEYGTKVTEWSPAPEDVESSAWYSLTGRANTSAPSNSDYLTAFNRNPVQGDILLVTDTNGTSKNYQYNGDSWDNITALIRGDMLVSGTVTASQIAADAITAEKIDVTNLSAISADLGDITGGSIDINSGTFTVDSDGNLTGTSVNLTGDITAQTLTLTGAQVADSRNATSLILSSSQLDQSVVNLIDQRIEGYGLASSGDFKEDIGGFNNTIPDHPVLENFTHLNGKDVVIELTASSTWSGTGSPTYPPQYPNNDSSLVIEIQRRVSTETDWDNAVVVDTITNGASLNTVITGGTWVYGYSSVWFNGLTINYTFNDDPATGTYDYRAFIKTIGTNYTGVSKFYFEANEAGTASGGGVNNYADSFSIADATGIMTIGRNGLTDLTADISTYVGNQVSALVDSAPVTLDTLNELAAALGDDANFAQTTATALGTKMPKAGGTFTGDVTFNTLITLPQNPVGTTYGNTISAIPTSMITQGAGDNDGWRLYGEAGATNDVKMIFEIIDDIETGDTWVFRNKKTYGDYAATEPFKIQGNGNIVALGTITASGYNKTNWDTAYGWGNHASAGYLTSLPSHTHDYLPLSGGTLTGGLSISGYNTISSYAGSFANLSLSGGLTVSNVSTIDAARNANLANISYSGSLTNGSIKQEWTTNYVLNNTTPKELLYSNGQSLPNGGVYRFSAHISGTGTDNWATAVYWNQNGTWKLNVTQQSGTSSNHPEFVIISNVPTLVIDHTSNYTVHVFAERLELNEGGGTDNYGGLGSDAFLSNVGGSLRYNPYGSGVDYSTGDKVFHDSYHPNADKWTTAKVLTLTGDVSGTVTWDGSANASITTAVADDSHNHSNYITSNADDSYSGNITATADDWYLWSLGARGASGGEYGIGNRNDNSFRQLTFHVPDRDAYSGAGIIPSFGWYSNGAVELMKLTSKDGNLSVKGGYQVNGTTVIDSSRNATNINTVTASGLIKGNQLASNYWVTKQLSGTQMGNSYNERVILLCPKIETSTSHNNIVDGKITMLKTGGNVCDSFEVFCHSVYNDTRATFTSRGQRTAHKFVTCTYGGIKWVAIKFEFTANPYNYALFQGQAYTNVTGHADNQLKIVSYYDTLNGGTILDSEIYNSIADYNPDNTYTVFENGSTTFNSPVYGKSDIRSFYSSTNYSQLESNISGGVLKLEGGGSTLLRSYGVSEFPNGLAIGTTTVIDSARNLTNIGTISASGGISVSGYNTISAYAGSFSFLTGSLTGNVTGTLTGNASSATKWATARTLSLTGDVTGSVSIDGSANASITATVANDSHTHDGRYYTETESDSRFVNVTGDTMTGTLAFSNTAQRDKIDLNGNDAHCLGWESYNNTYGSNTWNSGFIGHKFYANSGTLIANIGTGGSTTTGSTTSSFYGKLTAGFGTNNSESGVARFGGKSQGGEVDALSLVNSVTGATNNAVSLAFHNAYNYSPTGKITTVQRGAVVTDSSVEIYGYNGGLLKQVEIDYLGNLDVIRGGLQVNGTTVVDSSRNLDNINGLYIGQTSSGKSHYQWDGATYRNPDQWTAKQIIRIHNDSVNDNGHYPNLVLYNESGLLNSTVGLSFASREADNAGNSITLAGIQANKTLAGTAGAWSSGSLTFYVKDVGVRRNVMICDTDGGLNVVNSLKINTTTVIDANRNGFFGQTVELGNINETNQNLKIKYRTNSSGYGAVRFYENTSNRNTIHSFSSTWQNGTLSGASTDAINISGGTGVTFGAWNDVSAYITNAGDISAKNSLQINGTTVIDASRNISGVNLDLTGRALVWTNTDAALVLRQGQSGHPWNYIEFRNSGNDRNWYTGTDSSGNYVMQGEVGATGVYTNKRLTAEGLTSNAITYVDSDHGSTRLQLKYRHTGIEDHIYSGHLTLWTSEPGITYDNCGIGGNIHVDGQHYGRQINSNAYGVYLRFDVNSGFSEFWSTTGSAGATGGKGTRQWYVDASGNTNQTGYAAASEYKIGATTVIDSSRNLTNIGTISSTGNHTMNGDSYTLYGANSTWGSYLQVGGNSRQYVNDSNVASVVTSNGNLHLDASSGRDLYLNFYDGNKVYFGSGANGTVGIVDNTGKATFSSYTIGGTTVIDASRNSYLKSLRLDSGNNIEWGGAYTSGYPTIAASGSTASGFLAFYPTGNTNGETVRFNSAGINAKVGGYQVNGTTVIDSSRNLTNIGTITSGNIYAGNITSTVVGNNYNQVNSTNSGEAMHRYSNSVSNFWYVGIRSTTQLVGNTGYHIYSTAAAQTVMGLTAGGELRAKFNVVAYYSDERLKTKVSNLDNALSKVCSLNGFIYVENDKARELGYTNTNEQVALSAQEVQNVLPQAVSLAPIDCEIDENGNDVSISGENYLTVDYAKLVPLLVEAIKELKQEIEELKNGTNSN